jgi:hypothetical protein
MMLVDPTVATVFITVKPVDAGGKPIGDDG